MRINSKDDFIKKQREFAASLNSQKKQILICAGTGCVAGGSLKIYKRLKELIENKGDLDYTNEYNLNSKPIQMDLLVIK